MKTLIVFLIGIAVGAGGLYRYIMQVVDEQTSILVGKAILEVQNSLPETIDGIPTNASGAVAQEYLKKRYAGQKQQIIDKLEAKKEDTIQSIKDSINIFLHTQVDKVTGKEAETVIIQ